MKRITACLLALILAIFTGCSEELPDTYEFYADFRPQHQEVIQPCSTEGYTDITNDEYGPYFREGMGMDSILAHRIYKTKNAVIADFNINSASQIQLIRNYVYETFWLGQLHFITGGLPYEDWQHKNHIKTLCLQLWDVGGENVLLQDIYTFDSLEMSGFKAFNLETKVNESLVHSDQYIKLDRLLNSDREYAYKWLDIAQYTGEKYTVELYTSLLGEKLNVDIYTAKQLPPENLAPLYTHLYDKLKAIDTDITVNLFQGENSVNYTAFYYSYSSADNLPVAEETE